MEVSSRASCSMHERLSNDNLKRKRGDLDHTQRAVWVCKCSKTELSNTKHGGSVAYKYFAPEAYGCLAKVEGQESDKFQRSGIPKRVLFYDYDEWKDFNPDVMVAVQDAFRSGKSSIDYQIKGEIYFANFPSMWQLNISTGFLRSVAWIDEHEKCFFPSNVIGCHINQLPPCLRSAFDDIAQLVDGEVDVKSCLLNTNDVSISPDENSESISQLQNGKRTSDSRSESSVSTAQHTFVPLGGRIHRLGDDDDNFRFVKDLFVRGLGFLAKQVIISGIYDLLSSPLGEAKLQAFERQEEITRSTRGEANIKYAWHGASKQCISGIILHGFGQPRFPKNDAMYGDGVCLTPEDFAHVSALYSDIDESGEQHVLLCRVIMGNMEKVPFGSSQFHPRSEVYDSGVDDVDNPKRYIVWSTHMNTHILPHYVVCFKLSPPVLAAIMAAQGGKRSMAEVSRSNGETGSGSLTLKKKVDSCSTSQQSEEGLRCVKPNHRVPRSPWISFSKLFTSMKTKLPPVILSEVHQWYLEFQAGRLPRRVFIRKLRMKVSDDFIRDCIKNKESEVAALLSCW